MFILGFFLTPVFAIHAEWEQIKKFEEEEKKPPLEQIKRPQVEYRAEADGLRDPFQGLDLDKVTEPGAVESTGLPDEMPVLSLTVQGIIWGGKFPQAIVNNKVVKVGDTIEGGSRVLSIDRNRIIVFFAGRQYSFPSPAAGLSPSLKNPKEAKDE